MDCESFLTFQHKQKDRRENTHNTMRNEKFQQQKTYIKITITKYMIHWNGNGTSIGPSEQRFSFKYAYVKAVQHTHIILARSSLMENLRRTTF